jgi:integrase
VSEGLALDVKHLALNGSNPHVRVRRALESRGEPRFGRPKSRHGVRDVPLPPSVVCELRGHVAGLGEPHPKWGQLVFPSERGTPMRPENLRRRYLDPATEEADASWAGFHAFRHCFASMHIEAGTNVVQLSRLLGHHSPSFTLNVYAHLLDDGVGAPLDLDAELSRGANRVQTDATGTNTTETVPASLSVAV